MLDLVEVHLVAVIRLPSVVTIRSDLVVDLVVVTQSILDLVEVHLVAMIHLLSVVMIHSDLVVAT